MATNDSLKNSLDEISAKIEGMKNLMSTMYQDLLKWSATANANMEAVSKVEQTLNELAKISDEVSKDTLKTNQDILAKVNNATDMFINNKTQIAEEVIEKLRLDEKIETLENKINQMMTHVKEINDNASFISDTTSKLTLSINQLNMSISLLNKSMASLGLPTNYAEEASRVIDYMLSRRRGPPITFGELALKFNQNVVRQVLMVMHKLGYIEWR
jgi:chromosome segregation ATPase